MNSFWSQGREIWLFLCIFFLNTELYQADYQPNWPSLNSRALPAWYDDVKFGIFCHWGVYSVPAFNDAWMWWYWQGPKPYKSTVDWMAKNYRPGFSYPEFAPMFTAEYFDANEFRKLVEAAGARYFVFTSKHHDGYTMWPSNSSWNWNSVDTGPKKDIVGQLKKAFLGSPVHFGLYFSQMDFMSTLYKADQSRNWTTDDYVQQVSYPQMLDIVNAYQPEVIWSDGDWDTDDSYWKSKDFLTWLYNNSPVKSSVVVNDRWGAGDMGKNGGFLTFADHYDPGHLIGRKWENCMTMDVDSWGYRRAMRAEDVRTVKDLIGQLSRTISCGGNLLLNVGPTDHGIIVPIFQERLKLLGNWIKINQEAIYGTKPWIYQKDGDVWYTSRLRQIYPINNAHHRVHNPIFNAQDQVDTIVYAFILNWPLDDKLLLPSVQLTSKSKVHMLGFSHHLQAAMTSNGAVIDLSQIEWTKLPSLDAWVLKLEFLKSEERNPIEQLQLSGILDSYGLPVRLPPSVRSQRNFLRQNNENFEEDFHSF